MRDIAKDLCSRPCACIFSYVFVEPGERLDSGTGHVNGKRRHIHDFDVEVEVHFDNAIPAVNANEFACSDLTPNQYTCSLMQRQIRITTQVGPMRLNRGEAICRAMWACCSWA